jgi:general secretion pathway protein J
VSAAPRRRRRPSRASGFTLIEIALAVAVVAIMGTLTWGAIARSFDAYETVTEIDQRYHNVRVALNRMAREISMAFLTQPTRNLGPEEMWRTLFVAKSGTYYQLDFTSFAHEVMRQDAKEADQAEIGYAVVRDEDRREQRNLVRRLDPRLDREPDKGGVVSVLAEDVKGFKLRFFDPRNDDWTDEWDTTKPDHANRLPTLVEITLTIDDENGKPMSFVTKTRVNLTTALPRF